MAAIRQTPLSCSGHTRPVVKLAFSRLTPYGYFLISACKDGKPMLRQGDTGDWIGTFLGHKGAVWGATLNDDATRAATGAADFTAKVWDAVSGEETATFSHKHIVKSVDFSKDSSQLLTGGNEKLLKIFDLNKPEADPVVFTGHSNYVKDALFLPDGKRLVSGGDDKTVRMWDVASQTEVKKLEFDSIVTDMSLTKDGSILVVTNGRTVSFFNADSLEKLKSYSTPSHVYSASLNEDKGSYVIGGEDFKLYKFDYETGSELESYKGHFGPVHCVRFSPDGELYASGSEDGTLRLWQTNVGTTYGLWKCVLPEDAIEETNNGGNGTNSVKTEG
ncbi:hypothetical protein Bbelb_367340 [Branchiostoma belcheri]|nr:hypothetical protein Bbelb_367340 [Branchiostoma belcheri]